ncbi:MAG: FecR domain-containing protein [Acidobacteria bacterium]|nr:FecR domain-containing protein [Acidobacteriota bacterium]
MRPGVLHRLTAVWLCFFVVSLPIWAESNSAGQVTAVTTSTSRNSRPVRLKEEVNWNDVLQTDRSGRTRVTLRNGSILAVGSSSEIKVVEHDSDSQQTVVQLNNGRVRSRVVSITKPGGKFEVQTPVATANVVGTDFYTEYVPASNTFRLICYSGVVQVRGSGNLAGRSETVRAGQMIQVNANGLGAPQNTPNALQQDSIAQTTSESGDKVAGDSHVLRTVIIGAAAAAAGVVIGLVTTGAGASAAQPAAGTASDKKGK